MDNLRKHAQECVDKKLESIEKKLDHCLNVLNRGLNYCQKEESDDVRQSTIRTRSNAKDV